jgi:vacuolar-type H+-ATPase subunit F/Vma7
MSSAYHIIGDKDTVLGYRFAGVTGEVVENEEQARAAFHQATVRQHNGILLITEAVEDMLKEEVMAYRLKATPPFLTVVEDIWGKRGKRRSLQELIFAAVGIRIVEEK